MFIVMESLADGVWFEVTVFCKLRSINIVPIEYVYEVILYETDSNMFVAST